jgi:hypothetical protein
MNNSKAKLIVGDREFALGAGATTIGRHENNSIVFDDPSISSHHAEITQINERMVVRDLGSTNGTTVNGTPVIEAFLSQGDTLRFGSIHCRVAGASIALPPPLPLRCSTARPSVSFTAWPRHRVAAILATLLVSFFFIFATAMAGLAAGLLAGGVIYGLITTVRFAWHHLKKPNSVMIETRRPIPLWRHPVTLGIFGSCVIAFLLAIAMSASNGSAREDYNQVAARYQRDVDDHNSTERVAGEMLTQFEHGLALDFKGATKRSEQYQDRTDQLKAQGEDLRQWDYNLSKAQGSSDAMLGIAIVLLVML